MPADRREVAPLRADGNAWEAALHLVGDAARRVTGAILPVGDGAVLPLSSPPTAGDT